MVNMQGQMGDQELAQRVLFNHKLDCQSLTTVILECSYDALRNEYKNTLMKAFDHQKQIFDYMNGKGWYQVQPVSQQDLARAQSTIAQQ